MDTSTPTYRLREIRLARALAGSERDGLKAIEEIRSISRLAHGHIEQTRREEADLRSLGGAFKAIERQAESAEMRYSKILDVLYEFLHSGDEVEAQPK